MIITHNQLKTLAEAFKLITTGAAVNFPEGGSDLSKWEWSEVLSSVLIEAIKRRNLAPPAIVQKSERAVRRRLEAAKAEAILAQEFKPTFNPPQPQPKEQTNANDQD